MPSKDVWTTERRLWLEGVEAFEANMAPDAAMVFPPPVGILRKDSILETLRHAPRWESVVFEAAETVEFGPVTILAYLASAQRTGSDPYRAYCSSTYVRENGRALIVCHQQTPAPPEAGG